MTKRLLPLFAVVVIDLLGFGIIIPLFPFMGVRLGLSPAEITLILAVYSFCQFVAAPAWGRLSDRFGRRPILMCGMLGAAGSYVLLAFADSPAWLIASRALGGLMAGNLSAAFAYASDVTDEENRARGMGFIGAAVGLGFTLGPAIGGQLSGEGANLALPALVAAGMSFAAFLAVGLFLPESHVSPGHEREHGIAAWRSVLRRPVLAQLVLAGLLITTAHATLESIIALWALDRFAFGPREVGLLFLLIGGVLVIMQGGMVGRLTRRFGEVRVAMGGVLSYLLGLATLSLANDVALAVAGGFFCGVGAGAYTPSLASLVSKQADVTERGLVMGTYQSANSLARILGPAISGTVYVGIAREAPFLLGILIAVPALWLIVRSQRGRLAQVHPF
jgi:DHA1 family tetracycline resistance protein-like MFS transporter